MAKNDIKIIDSADAIVIKENVASGAANSLHAGDAVKKNGNYVVRIATGDPEIGTDEGFGICVSESTDTAAADGNVNVMYPIAGKTIMRCKATDSTGLNTAAKLLGLQGDCITLDLTSTTITIDEDEGDDPNVHGLKVVGGSVANGTLDFVMQSGVGLGGSSVGQTRD
jgi:hypothetical protein